MGRPTGVMYVGQNFVWVGQARVWVGHGLPGLIAKTASAASVFVRISPYTVSSRFAKSLFAESRFAECRVSFSFHHLHF